ncbi:hypothetical protein OIU76_002771 [Salix suchowensis]|nr:hypothetical protein OIU76_002771 [Salix suchowensis]
MICSNNTLSQKINGDKKEEKKNVLFWEIVVKCYSPVDSLVSNHPLCEHQTDRTSALKCSIEDKKKGVSDLKNLHGDLISHASSLAAEREALKKRPDEIAEEEIQIREDAEDLRTQLISRKAELETYMKALPEALRQQNEAENRANNSNDQWGEIRSLSA